MIDNKYRNAFKEVYIILQNTDDELVKRIPKNLIEFLHNNMNTDYQTNIDNTIEINKQTLLAETEDILSFIYRGYWATDEEKLEFFNKDKQELAEAEENKKHQYKDIDEIFEKRKNLDNITLDNSLDVIPKENFVIRFLNKILKIFKK